MTNLKSKYILEKWHMHPLLLDHINLNKILYNGQSFRWRWYFHDTAKVDSSINGFLDKNKTSEFSLIKIHYNTIRLPASDSAHMLKLCQHGQRLYFSTPDSKIVTQVEDFLIKMLQLNVDRLELYKNISQLDNHLKNLLSPHLESLDFKKLECTIMKLPAWETLLSFICSSNNNILRISSMCHKLCEIGGEKVTEIEVPVYDGEEFIEYQTIPMYAFPTCQTLLEKCDENMLKEAKFGYRARYITQTLQLFDTLRKTEGFETLSDSQFMCHYMSPAVREMTYEKAKAWLIQFSGCGPKVADCVLLYSDVALENIVKQEEKSEFTEAVRTWNGIIPFDAHITRIAIRDFPHIVKKNHKNLDLMRKILMAKFGNFGGWIQVLLFTKEIERSSRS